MEKIDLDELERLAKAATPGPWKYRTIGREAVVIMADTEPLCATKYRHNKDHDAAYIVVACNAVPELIARVRELEERIAELTQENSSHKRVIHILENKALALKEKPIPMEPRQFIPSSNRSNAKEAGE
ncbi:MAG: hypothetical protein IKY97_07775 [Mailhella sp.]|nr:hypothetical protein [Mailhella sp.]